MWKYGASTSLNRIYLALIRFRKIFVVFSLVIFTIISLPCFTPYKNSFPYRLKSCSLIRFLNESDISFQELENQKTQFLDRIPEEPIISNPNCVCISFKMPNGERLERRFLSTHTLRVRFSRNFKYIDKN